MTKQERDTIRVQYKAKIPEPLTNQFTDRVSKDTAIKRHEARKELRTELFPSGEVFTKDKKIYISYRLCFHERFFRSLSE